MAALWPPRSPEFNRSFFDSWPRKVEHFKTKMQNTCKIPKYQNTLKIPKYIEILHFFPKFPNFGAKVSHVFKGFQPFSTDFSVRARKMRKNAAFAVKIGVDTADICYFGDILMLWLSIEIRVELFERENLRRGTRPAPRCAAAFARLCPPP